MNKKLIVVIVLFGIGVLGVVTFLLRGNLPLNREKNIPSEPVSSKDTVKIIQEQKNVSVSYTENGFTPPSVEVKKGGIVGIFNSTKEEVHLLLTGKMGTLLKIKPNSTIFTPVFTENGEYKLMDSNESSTVLNITVNE